MSYTPNQKKYITIAQTRSNDGTKDIKFIYDTEADAFYVLDENGNFTAMQTGDNLTLAGLTLTGTAEFQQNVTFGKAAIVKLISNSDSGASIDLNYDTLANNQVFIDANNGQYIYFNGDTDELIIGNTVSSPESRIVIDETGIRFEPSEVGGLAFISAILPKFANNAAAIAGGLGLNNLYSTVTGEVRVVV